MPPKKKSPGKKTPKKRAPRRATSRTKASKRKAPQKSNGMTRSQVKKLSGNNKDSEYFLPFCSTCTDPCCNGYILATQSERRGIIDRPAKDNFKKHRNYYVHEADCCQYLEKDLCSIHSDRPTICRIYPFFIDGDSGELAIDPTCPAAETLPARFKPKAKRRVNKLVKEMGWKNFLHFWLT